MSSLSSRDLDQAGGAVRLQLSDQQWLTLVSRLQRGEWLYEGPDRRNRRAVRYRVRLRCVIRAQQPDGRSATYLVRSHNISAGGMGFLHNEPLPRGSRCTIAMQSLDGEGLIAAGRVAWVRQLDTDVDAETSAFEVGIQFDRPIDPTPFIEEPPLPPSG